jgi:hypothetical protein
MEHPITPPPPALVRQWINDAFGPDYEQCITTAAAQWGADQELEECCEWLFKSGYDVAPVCLRAARRPKPSSLKEQALSKLVDIYNDEKIDDHAYDTIRCALEALPND